MDKGGVPNTRRFCACWGRKGGVPEAGLSRASNRAVRKSRPHWGAKGGVPEAGRLCPYWGAKGAARIRLAGQEPGS